MAARVMYSTWPDEAQAAACAEDLISRRLAACVTILPAATSIFRWEGKIARQSECVMFAKTDPSRAAALRDALRAAHPYELPCILALDADPAVSSADFLQWVATETEA